ncbi:MAG: flippase [Eubacteriales bacterium]
MTAKSRGNKAKKESSLMGRFVGNTGWMMFRNIYSMLISLIVGSLSARYLGPSNYGLLNYGSSIIAFFTTVSKLGMDSFVVGEMARNPEKENSYLGSALIMRLVTSILSFFAIWGIVVVLEPDNRLLQTVTVLQAVAIVFQSAEVFYFWFQVRLKMKYVTLASIAALTVTGAWRILLLANQATVQWFALSASISALVCGGLVMIFFLTQAKAKLTFCPSDARYILQNSYHFIINGLAVTLYTQLDRIMLGKVVSEDAVGFYSAASTIAVLWEFVPNAIIHSASPLLIKEYDKDKNSFEKKYKMLLAGIALMGVAVGIGFTVFSKLVIFVLYGKAYYPAIPALSILIWSTGFAMIGTARGIWVIAGRKNRYVKYYTFIGAVVNLVLNLLVIPVWGIVGASITTLFSQIVVSLIAPLFFKETRAFPKLFFSSFAELPNLFRSVANRLLKPKNK